MMRNQYQIYLFAFLCFLSPLKAHAFEKAQFYTVIDGDSLLVGYQNRSWKVRLIGIDAPEWGQEYGKAAKTKILELCSGEKLQLEFDTRLKDKYGRLLAYVYCNGKMLNETLVLKGLALAKSYPPNTKHQKILNRAQRKAQTERNGFWIHGGLQQTPAQWRKTHKKR